MSLVNPYISFRNIPMGSYTSAIAITPSDVDDLPVVPQAIRANSTGTIRVTFLNDQTVDLHSPFVAFFECISVKRIWATGTTAEGIILLW